jgi:hypothetical protein
MLTAYGCPCTDVRWVGFLPPLKYVLMKVLKTYFAIFKVFILRVSEKIFSIILPVLKISIF